MNALQLVQQITRNRGSFLSGLTTLLILLLSLTVSYAQRTSGTTSSGTIGNEEIQGHVFFPPGGQVQRPPRGQASEFELSGSDRNNGSRW